ncbi:LCP family protein [Leifsonia sp. A12D58]|uniref:LCP family protein n=1 Tax=Leifsonia sp. A12D58 TaxID=3397674 RepID=UPI0039DFF60B
MNLESDAEQDQRPAAHHRRRSRWSGVRPYLKGTALALAVVLVSGVSLGGIYVWQLGAKVGDNALDISNGTEVPDADQPGMDAFTGGFSVLAVGADNATGQSEAYGDRGRALNDVNILFHVSADHQSAVVMSLPRDLVIPQPSCVDPETGEEFDEVYAEPLNDAFGRGGLGCVKATIEELTGLSIPYAALFTFEGTVAMSDAVGGVPICLDSAIYDPWSGLDLPAGVTNVSGQQALAYLRSRKGVGSGSDLSRITSQQAYMSSLMRVMKSSETLTDVSKVLGLANAAAEHVSLSQSLASITTMASMALTLKDLDLDKLVFVQYPVEEDPDNSNKVVPSPDLAERLIAKILADEPFVLDEASLGEDVVLDPAAPVAPPAPDDAGGAEDSAAPIETEVPVGTESPATPEVLDGLRGQTASQQTCSVAN